MEGIIMGMLKKERLYDDNLRLLRFVVKLLDILFLGKCFINEDVMYIFKFKCYIVLEILFWFNIFCGFYFCKLRFFV